MAMGLYLEEALADVLYEGKSLKELLTEAGVTQKKLYIGFSTALPKAAGLTPEGEGAVTWASVKECQWGGYTARTEWPATAGTGTEHAGSKNTEGSAAEVKNKAVITVSGEVTTSVTNPVMEYVFWADSATFEAGHVWFWAKLAAKATVEVTSTEGVKFEPKALVVKVT